MQFGKVCVSRCTGNNQHGTPGMVFSTESPEWVLKKKQKSNKTPPPSLGGLEPPTFRLTAERANRLRHRDNSARLFWTLFAVDTY